VRDIECVDSELYWWRRFAVRLGSNAAASAPAASVAVLTRLELVRLPALIATTTIAVKPICPMLDSHDGSIPLCFNAISLNEKRCGKATFAVVRKTVRTFGSSGWSFAGICLAHLGCGFAPLRPWERPPCPAERRNL
jgi:hypothetical protein